MDPAKLFADRIRKRITTGEPSRTVLFVDDRVLARITDNIYREPSSAIRELVSNAYDADATEVVIETDAPRYDRIVVRDNGVGMSPEILADLVHHIGGSSKRTAKGAVLGTTQADDAKLSPGGRKLIGKIGIGLFAVSQLTQHFQIITKRAGDSFRTSADVILQTYTEEEVQSGARDVKFKTGEIEVVTEPASDRDSHGTEIILTDLRPAIRSTLRSEERWTRIDDGEVVLEPLFHMGRLDQDASTETGQLDTYRVAPSLPWSPLDDQLAKFRKLYDGLVASQRSMANPTISDAFDKYFQTMWSISLASPLEYIESTPFSLEAGRGIEFFRLSNEKRKQVVALDEPVGEPVGANLGLTAFLADPIGGFKIVFDGVELRRPITFPHRLNKRSVIARPLMFFGEQRHVFKGVDSAVSGGALGFSAYFYWNSAIVPKESNGLLIRVNNAAGAPFDRYFLHYQVSEMQRLRQLTAEIFVDEGFDPALNLDRESYNLTHPHYVYLAGWVHQALRQIMNRLKAIGAEANADRKLGAAEAGAHESLEVALRIWHERRGDDADRSTFADVDEGTAEHAVIVAAASSLNRSTPDTFLSMQAALIVLDAFDALLPLSDDDQSRLVAALMRVLNRAAP